MQAYRTLYPTLIGVPRELGNDGASFLAADALT
jgi:hypothetical protein